jgi:hypothetical protein
MLTTANDLEQGSRLGIEKQGRGGFDMVRMFRRLMRSGHRPRVVGGWLV